MTEVTDGHFHNLDPTLIALQCWAVVGYRARTWLVPTDSDAGFQQRLLLSSFLMALSLDEAVAAVRDIVFLVAGQRFDTTASIASYNRHDLVPVFGLCSQNNLIFHCIPDL